jgi:hypothetical protein
MFIYKLNNNDIKIWADEKICTEVAEQSGFWSEQVLDMSGLLSESIA